MKITVYAKPRSREKRVVKNSDGSYTVYVSEPPDDGKANRAIIRAFAEYRGIAQTHIEIVSGYMGKKKILNIL